uniref:Uncharacterized protein n=1 Tax=Cacopsylla melanoneura TaxID=428564 RepID=A0A8D9ELS2_9HEMI
MHLAVSSVTLVGSLMSGLKPNVLNSPKNSVATSESTSMSILKSPARITLPTHVISNSNNSRLSRKILISDLTLFDLYMQIITVLIFLFSIAQYSKCSSLAGVLNSIF